jgi:hypothetical protein
VIEEGPYTPFDIVAAGALSLVLIGYYRTPAVQGKEALGKAAALGGIVALLANIGLAYFVQEFLLRIDYYPECRFSRDPPQAECVADLITVGIMPIISALFFIIGTVIGLVLQRRAVRQGVR